MSSNVSLSLRSLVATFVLLCDNRSLESLSFKPLYYEYSRRVRARLWAFKIDDILRVHLAMVREFFASMWS